MRSRGLLQRLRVRGRIRRFHVDVCFALFSPCDSTGSGRSLTGPESSPPQASSSIQTWPLGSLAEGRRKHISGKCQRFNSNMRSWNRFTFTRETSMSPSISLFIHQHFHIFISVDKLGIFDSFAVDFPVLLGHFSGNSRRNFSVPASWLEK